MRYRTYLAALIALAAVSGAASAQGLVVTATTPKWEGFFAGLNAGGAWNTTCNTWTANGPAANTPAFNDRDCPNKSIGVGGFQFGYNFQHEQWVWGFELDYDFWSAKNKSKSFTYTGNAFPPGTYTFSGKLTPNGVAIIGPRLGYAIDNWLPYIRAGGVFTSGTHDIMASYTPTGASSPDATFNGGKNSASHGFGISLGTEYKVADQWSVKFEYTYIKLGKSSQNSTTSCNGSVAACDAFAGASLDSIHNSFTASLLRVGFNYDF
jgi:outer membrane immunogenic protein